MVMACGGFLGLVGHFQWSNYYKTIAEVLRNNSQNMFKQ